MAFNDLMTDFLFPGKNEKTAQAQDNTKDSKISKRFIEVLRLIIMLMLMCMLMIINE